MNNLISKILTKKFRLRIIRYLSNDLSLLINADVLGCVTPKRCGLTFFNSMIEPVWVERGECGFPGGAGGNHIGPVVDTRVRRAASKALNNPNSSKAAKTANGSALSQRSRKVTK